MSKDRVVWLARCVDNGDYAIFEDEIGAIRFADELGYWFCSIEQFCPEEFERITNKTLNPGEYCPVIIEVKNVLK